MTQCDRILAILQDKHWHSTKELMNETKIWYPPRRIWDLKKNGYEIESRMGELCEEYRLISSPSIKIEKESANKLSQPQSEQNQPAMFESKNPL